MFGLIKAIRKNVQLKKEIQDLHTWHANEIAKIDAQHAKIKADEKAFYERLADRQKRFDEKLAKNRELSAQKEDVNKRIDAAFDEMLKTKDNQRRAELIAEIEQLQNESLNLTKTMTSELRALKW